LNMPNLLVAGLMKIENIHRYAPLAVGLKPSAMQGKARLRGLYRIIYSKTIISVYERSTPKFIAFLAKVEPNGRG